MRDRVEVRTKHRGWAGVVPYQLHQLCLSMTDLLPDNAVVLRSILFYLFFFILGFLLRSPFERFQCSLAKPNGKGGFLYHDCWEGAARFKALNCHAGRCSPFWFRILGTGGSWDGSRSKRGDPSARAERAVGGSRAFPLGQIPVTNPDSALLVYLLLGLLSIRPHNSWNTAQWIDLRKARNLGFHLKKAVLLLIL